MKRLHAKLVALGILTTGCVGTALGQAQDARGKGNGQPAPTAAGEGRQKPPRAITNETAQDAAAAMRRNGSSLLKATMNARRDPSQARLADVSFHAVPEPTPRTLRKHDQVTIIVREESQFRSKGSSELKKDTEFQARLDEWIRLHPSNWAIEGGAAGANPPSIKYTGKRDFKGEGQVDRSDQFTTRVQAEVVDVKPNGTLVLQARSRIKTDDEEQFFVLTGVCRAEDVNADNTILSSQLYDKSIDRHSKGNVRNATRKGWLENLLDVISPF